MCLTTVWYGNGNGWVVGGKVSGSGKFYCAAGMWQFQQLLLRMTSRGGGREGRLHWGGNNLEKLLSPLFISYPCFNVPTRSEEYNFQQ